ncbi:clc-like protein 2 [Asbolus verrucosus]|uniref:Clc-like protein 2 n=1 Tax=Asbolus verrucosus TaxID=1661398 RepID=A0A482VN62_ASBVE|nr:clc-like protein 2 [Asbolus verrucosus]
MADYDQTKRRSLAGNVGIAFFVIAFVLIAVAFSTPSWLVSDYRINGAKLDRLGLWTHCFRSLADPNDVNQKRFFVGCRWIYDPFTTGYDQIRGFLIPGFMVATQFFFTLCFISVLISAILTLLYFLCCGPDQKQFVLLIQLNAWILLIGGLCGALAVIIFASLANKNGWMPGHDNNFFGWSFVLACIGVVACLVASALFMTDGYVQQRKRRQLMESQTRFELERGTKA